MCIECFEKKHILVQGLGINDNFSCFGKGVEEKWQTCLTKFSQAWAIFRINIASTATGTEGQIIPWALCLHVPVQPPASCLWRWWCGAVCAPLWGAYGSASVLGECSCMAPCPVCQSPGRTGVACVRQPLRGWPGGGSSTILGAVDAWRSLWTKKCKPELSDVNVLCFQKGWKEEI